MALLESEEEENEGETFSGMFSLTWSSESDMGREGGGGGLAGEESGLGNPVSGILFSDSGFFFSDSGFFFSEDEIPFELDDGSQGTVTLPETTLDVNSVVSLEE